MKKIILLLLIFIVSGCSINGNKDFESICIKNETADGFIEEKKITIYFDQTDNIKKIINNYKYIYSNDNGKLSFEAAKMSLNDYMKNKEGYLKEIITEKENEYEVNYILNVIDLTDEELKKININRNYYNQIKKYKEDYICE